LALSPEEAETGERSHEGEEAGTRFKATEEEEQTNRQEA
jgi:hypothetical protein